MGKWLLGLLALLALALGVGAYVFLQRVEIVDYPKPIRVETEAEIPDSESVIVTSIGIPLDVIRRGLEKDVPRTLWSIDERRDNCVPRQNIRVLGRQIARTPKVKCRITGDARRGAIQLRGAGNRLVARFPVTATVRARDIGGVIKQETATATAMMEVATRFTVTGNWRPKADVDLNYRWVREPGIDILGQRVTFTKPANRELRKILRGVEASLQRQVAREPIRPKVAKLWSSGFTRVSLSRENPPVWLTIEPKSTGIGEFRVTGRELRADVLLSAQTRVFVGEEPAPPVASPLGRNRAISGGTGFVATVPVLADYAELEPVLLRALTKFAEKGLEREDLGRIELEFESVEVYATTGGRIAVGVVLTAQPVGNLTGRWKKTKGEVWLTGMPVTKSDSQIVRIDDLKIFGDMDQTTGDILIRIIDTDDIRSEIEAALVENFQKDYDRILAKVRDGLANVPAGEASLSFTLSSVTHGEIAATGSGLYMPVEAKGAVDIDIRLD
ncbi:DUF4403 family protein [Parerythrobacter jejuensis]|uniref:DUF4403 family protein n=1 Tax=Parerythrobacter jejuensis TaxID=795812 RepID=A0A845AS55_9SPHN|nr:DUF4403 family protein [Parerythrobacter jejuensis]MXP31671.1 DUF4403 family protein [Parerythrobacter jejuensis]